MWGKIVDSSRTVLVATKWITEIFLLTFFWLVVLPSYMRSDYFTDAQFSEAIRDSITLCAKPSIDDMMRRLLIILGLNLVFNLAVRFAKLSVQRYHIVSIVTGCLVLYVNSYPRNLLLISSFLLIGWTLLKRVHYVMMQQDDMIRPVYIMSSVLVVILVLGELFFPFHDNWQECRGVLMIMAMKMISVSMKDYDLIHVTNLEFFGYLLCPATLLFGPWIKVQEYRQYYAVHAKLNWKWAVKIVQIFTYAMICMVLSNCLTRMLLIPEETLPCKWHEAFRNAWVFRASHYFICYMAELTMITAGFNHTHKKMSHRWQYAICHPFAIEFPRSIASVVRNWNIPVHRFLKNYVYLPYVDVGKTYATIITFFFSSLLHGLNIRITAILISLAILSLSQKVIQEKIAACLKCCCRINSCRPDCDHRFGFYHPITIAINGINLVLNVVHLAYFGYIMDERFESSSLRDLYGIWDEDFHLFSHHIILGWLATMLFIV